jgi:hypothetical protein
MYAWERSISLGGEPTNWGFGGTIAKIVYVSSERERRLLDLVLLVGSGTLRA